MINSLLKNRWYLFIDSPSFLEKILLSILILFPPALISGPFLTDVVVSFSSLIFLFIFVKNNKKNKIVYFKNKYVLLLFIWNAYLIILSVFSENPFLSFESSLFYFRFTIFSICLWYVLENYKNFLRNFIILFILTYTVVVFDGYFQLIFGVNMIGIRTEWTEDRISGLFVDELILGSYLSRFLPLIIFFTFKLSNYINRDLRKFLSAFFFITGILIFFSGERTALFYFFLTFIIFIIFIKNFRKIFFIYFIASILVISLFSVYDSKYKERMFDYTVMQLNLFGKDDGHSGEERPIFTLQHQVIYETSYKIFLEHPFFGIGPKMFREICGKEKFQTITVKDHSVDGCQTSPHNTYVQLFVETGLIGTIPIIIILFCVFLNFIINFLKLKNKKSQISIFYKVCFMTCFLITLWPFVPTGNIFNNWLSAIYYLPLGFFLANKNKILS